MDPGLQYLIDQAPTAALALIGLWLFGTGRLHSDNELRQLRRDYDTERQAHDQTRAALAAANARADAGVRAAELVASAVEGARHGSSPPPRAA